MSMYNNSEQQAEIQKCQNILNQITADATGYTHSWCAYGGHGDIELRLVNTETGEADLPKELGEKIHKAFHDIGLHTEGYFESRQTGDMPLMHTKDGSVTENNVCRPTLCYPDFNILQQKADDIRNSLDESRKTAPNLKYNFSQKTGIIHTVQKFVQELKAAL